MNKITGAEYPIKEIFSKNFYFKIPTYQRPYAWTTEHSQELFDDLLGFMNTQGDNEAYFLGSIVLIKDEDNPEADVIDGQQRLTTLTILLATLSFTLGGKKSETIAEYINEPGNEVEGLESKPRLTLRERDKDFFYKYIQDIRLDDLVKRNEADLSHSHKNIRNNTELFMNKMKTDLNNDQEKIFNFAKFVANRCYLVAVSTPTMQSAYRIFSVLNDRGLNLLLSDILKADIIGKLPNNKQDLYTTKWEELEDELGRDEFNMLFSHIRMIYIKSKAKKTMLEEYTESILSGQFDSENFIDNEIVPYAESYQTILKTMYQSTDDAYKINNSFEWLLRIDNSDWIPSAILFLTKNQGNRESLECFFSLLERLAASLAIRGIMVNYRINRYAKVLTAIEKNTILKKGSPLFLTDDEKKEVLQAISGDVYLMPNRKRTYLLLRLDSFLSDKMAVINHKYLTVEHVLPQKISGEGKKYWEKHWPDENEQNEWLHKLGNLVLLSRRINIKARNFPFPKKKNKYFCSEEGVSSFPLTTTVIKEDNWTPDIVKKRQKELIKTIKDGWDLDSI